MFSSLQLRFSQWPRPPLTGHFQAICKRGDLRLSDDNPKDLNRLMYLCSCRRTASNLCSSASFRPSSASVALANVQLFKPIGLLVSNPGQVALTRTGKSFVMCNVCGLVDVVMKHTSRCLNADSKRRFWTG